MQIESNQYTLDIDEWSNQTHGRLTSKNRQIHSTVFQSHGKYYWNPKISKHQTFLLTLNCMEISWNHFFIPKKMMTYFHRALNWLQGSSPNSTFTAWSVWLGWPQLKGWLFSPQLPIGENGHSNGMIMWTCAYYTLEAFFFLSGCHMSWSQWQQLWEVKEVPKHQACTCTRKKA